MKLPVLLDCDPGIDDAVAIAVLAAAEQIDLKAITTCAGNQLPSKTYANARNLLYLMGKEQIPVYQGAQKPLYRELLIAGDIHGDTGLGEVVLEQSPAPHTNKSAIQLMGELVAETPGIIIAATGPLTNIAIFLAAYPELKQNIQRIVLMGGAYYGGNLTPCGEFNIAVDPEAAKLVFESGVPIEMFGLDVTRQAQFYQEDIQRLSQLGNRTGKLLAKMVAFHGVHSLQPVLAPPDHVEGMHMHDPCVAAYLLQPELFTMVPVNVAVETKGEYTAGCTVVDYYHKTGRTPNANVAFAVDRKKFVDLVCNQVAKLK